MAEQPISFKLLFLEELLCCGEFVSFFFVGFLMGDCCNCLVWEWVAAATAAAITSSFCIECSSEASQRACNCKLPPTNQYYFYIRKKIKVIQ